jgi:hypothetical protein
VLDLSEAARHGLAIGFGDTASVGIGGLTLGGGVGYLARKHGLTIDSLLAAELVTADGRTVRTDADTHPELFWAIRGGGGNFGVATRLRFQLHELDGVVGGMLLLPATVETVAGFVAAAEAAPEAGERALAPFRALATPLADLVRPIAYLGDDGPARIRQAYPGPTWERLVAVKRRWDPHQPVPAQPQHPTRWTGAGAGGFSIGFALVVQCPGGGGDGRQTALAGGQTAASCMVGGAAPGLSRGRVAQQPDPSPGAALDRQGDGQGRPVLGPREPAAGAALRQVAGAGPPGLPGPAGAAAGDGRGQPGHAG